MSKNTIDFGNGLIVDADQVTMSDIDLDDGEILNEDGTVFTEAQAEALAAELIAQFDADELYRAKAREYGKLGGHPPVPDELKARHAKQTRLNDAEATRLKSLAEEKGISESKLIREAINEYFSRLDKASA